MGSPLKKFSTLTYFRFFFGFDPGTPYFFLNPRKKRSNKAGPTLKTMNTISKSIFGHILSFCTRKTKKI